MSVGAKKSHGGICYPESREIVMVPGRWQDVLSELNRYDGLLLHTYPLSSEEMMEILSKSSTFAEHFFPYAAELLNPGGRFTYFTNDADSISRAHQRSLLQHFAGFRVHQLDGLTIPESTADAHWFHQIITIEAFAR